MDKFKKEIIIFLKKETGVKEIALEEPPDPKMGDYAFPCFSLSKELKKSPNKIAKDLASRFKPTEYVSESTVIGPYINFFVSKKKLAETVIKKILKEKQNYCKGDKKTEKAMVEYCQVNTHKAFHVGHLRGTMIGSALIRLLRYHGYDVIAANYQGDIGAHVAKCIWYLKNHNHGDYPEENKGRWLGKIYQKANAMLSNASGRNKQKYDEEVSNVLQALENGEPHLTELWQKTRQWSLDDFEAFYNLIGVEFDEYFFESQMEKPGKELVNDLLDRKIAQKSEGAVIINLEKYRLGNYLLLKSDGTSLYSTKDIALAKLKFDQYDISKSIHVVGSEQKLYFRQLFRTLELMGFKNAKNCVHVPYDLVTLEGGKISSREGVLIYADELVEDVISFAEKEVKKRHDDWDKERTGQSAKKIALSSVKFGMLNQDNNKAIVFNPGKAMDFEGETGPYVQYAHARICSIFRKSGKDIADFDKKDIDYSLLNHDAEMQLISQLGRFGNILEAAAENYRVYLLCHYLIRLAQQFNEFYHNCPILAAKPELMKSRLALAAGTKQVLEIGLNLLGIEAPDEM
ncbi:MAG: arginine--tRNA ligase [Nanoarchaeota archaeon]|nr:arginine--tRNA ligase [Nanoarchaeota archaeon]